MESTSFAACTLKIYVITLFHYNNFKLKENKITIIIIQIYVKIIEKVNMKFYNRKNKKNKLHD